MFTASIEPLLHGTTDCESKGLIQGHKANQSRAGPETQASVS